MAMIAVGCSTGQTQHVSLASPSVRVAEFSSPSRPPKIRAYKRALAFLAKSFADSNSAIKIQDEADGRIIAHVNIHCPSREHPDAKGIVFAFARASLDVRVTAREIKQVYEDVRIVDSRGYDLSWGQVSDNASMESVKTECLKPIADDLANAVRGT